MRDLILTVKVLLVLAAAAAAVFSTAWVFAVILAAVAALLPLPSRNAPDRRRGLDALRRTERTPEEREPKP